MSERTDLDLEKIKDLYLNHDMHERDIAKIFNTSRARIQRLIKGQSWEKSPKQKKADHQRRTRETNLKRYGVEVPTQSKKIMDKIKKTNLERYGCTCTLNNPEINKKKLETYQKHYGCHPKKEHFTHLENLNREFVLEHFVHNQELDFIAFTDYFNISGVKARRLKYMWNLTHLKNKLPRHRQEHEVLDFIRVIDPELKVYYQNRTLINPLEIDFYIPDKHLAIEYDGIMYHSFGHHHFARFNNADDESSEKLNHLLKTRGCEEKEVQLLHIFSSEWEQNSKIWKSLIENKLGLSKRIYARKCIVKEVPNKDSFEFLEQCHLQGNCPAKVKLGLYLENELVALMTFGKPRYNKNYQWELLRYCCKLNTTVVGGASKLLNHFIKTYFPDNIISYANRRWSSGNLYKKLGFELIRETDPGYYYFHPKEKETLLPRIQFQKHKLANKLENFDPELSETQNMYNNGYRKIYDCGQLVFALTLNEIH